MKRGGWGIGPGLQWGWCRSTGAGWVLSVPGTWAWTAERGGRRYVCSVLGPDFRLYTPRPCHRQVSAPPAEGAPCLPRDSSGDWQDKELISPCERLAASPGRKAKHRDKWGRGVERHSRGDPGEGAVPRQQVARREVGDTKLVHHVTLRVQDPAHCYALVL